MPSISPDRPVRERNLRCVSGCSPKSASRREPVCSSRDTPNTEPCRFDWRPGGLFAEGPLHALYRSEEHTSELQSLRHLVCRLLLEKKKIKIGRTMARYNIREGGSRSGGLRLC